MSPRGRHARGDDGPSLREAQAWFSAVIMHPESVELGATEAGRDAQRVVTAGPRLDAIGRMEIYHHAYRARLVECLADDYPALQHALGDAFEGLARDYIARHPSDGFSLNDFGRHMASFCRLRPELWRDFAADLAALEWAMVEVLHAADAPPLSLDEMGRLPPERWIDARFTPGPAVRLIRSSYPVNAYLQAFRDGDEPVVPAPAASATAVYRSGWTIWRMDLTPPMAAVLEALFAGQPLGEALGAIEALDAQPYCEEALAEASQRVMIWFREWVSGGLFATVSVE